MSFWDTVAGHEFTKYVIPQLTQAINELIEKSNRKQYICSCAGDEFEETVKAEIEKGSRYLNHFQNGSKVCIVFEGN